VFGGPVPVDTTVRPVVWQYGKLPDELYLMSCMSLGWQLHCHLTLPFLHQMRQYNCHTNRGLPQTKNAHLGHVPLPPQGEVAAVGSPRSTASVSAIRNGATSFHPVRQHEQYLTSARQRRRSVAANRRLRAHV